MVLKVTDCIINHLELGTHAQVMVSEVNTQFVENAIFIMKNILDNKVVEGHSDHLGIASIEPLMLAIVK